jgi:HK97 family phage major capsid protein
MTVNYTELQTLLDEAEALNSKPKLSPQEKRSYNLLLLRISAVKNGQSLREIDEQVLNDHERRNGLPVTRFDRSEKRAAAREWQRLIAEGIRSPEKRVDLFTNEYRDQTVGHTKPNYLLGTQGAFVPRTFFPGVTASMKWYDPIFDPDVVTYTETESGNPMQVGFMSDVEATASVVTAENSNQAANELDIAQAGEVDVLAYSYRTPMWRLSIEALQDLDQLTTAIELFQRFSADRVARGVAHDLIGGNGLNRTLGLLTSLVALGSVAQGALATGDSESTGGGQTGSNSIGSTDLNTLYFSVDQAYRQSPKCAWLCNDSTRVFLSSIVDKSGLPLMKLIDGRDTLLGKPVITSPSMPAMGSGTMPIVFGDLSYWITRHATAGDRVQLIKEASGLIEQGEVGLRTWSRWDGALMYSSASGTCPIKYLVMHS